MLDLNILGLSFFQLLSLTISIVIILIIRRKFKLTRHQWQLFIATTLFWASIKLVRSFTKLYAEDILGVDKFLTVAMIVGAYGLISIFVRLPIGMLSDKFKNRKVFIYISSTLILISSFLAFISPNFYTLYLSSLMIGVGASVWGLLNVLFAESFKGKNKYISVSIISIAPLLADYIVAPFQELSLENSNLGISYIWLFSSIFAGVTILYTLFIKEINLSSKGFSFETFFKLLSDKKLWSISIIGLGVLLIKFANSGANAISFADELNMPNNYKAFFDTMFSLPQLIAGVLVGTYLTKKIGAKYSLVLGLSLTLTFNVICSFLIEGSSFHILFFSYILNGLGYGITYNVLIGLALNNYKDNERATAMGFYQTILAIGIFYGSSFSSYTSDIVGSYSEVYIILSYMTIILIPLTIIIIPFDIDEA